MDNAGDLVAGIGDFDGDQRPDLVIAAPTSDVHGAHSGTLYGVLGPRLARARGG
jgi:hypothetical protein